MKPDIALRDVAKERAEMEAEVARTELCYDCKTKPIRCKKSVFCKACWDDRKKALFERRNAVGTRPDIALRYAVRRRSDDWYYKVTKSSYLKKWDKDDPRRKHWTPDVDEATLYPLKGIKSIVGQLRGEAREDCRRLLAKQKLTPHTRKDKPAPEEYEVVRFVCTEQPEVVPV